MQCVTFCAICVSLSTLAYARFDGHIYWNPIVERFVQDVGPGSVMPRMSAMNGLPGVMTRMDYGIQLGPGMNKRMAVLSPMMDREQGQLYEGVGMRPKVLIPQRHLLHQGYPLPYVHMLM